MAESAQYEEDSPATPDDRFKLEQLHLRLRKFFSARTILLDSHQPQALFQHSNPQLRVL
jgi:hypothetical protein